MSRSADMYLRNLALVLALNMITTRALVSDTAVVVDANGQVSTDHGYDKETSLIRSEERALLNQRSSEEAGDVEDATDETKQFNVLASIDKGSNKCTCTQKQTKADASPACACRITRDQWKKAFNLMD